MTRIAARGRVVAGRLRARRPARSPPPPRATAAEAYGAATGKTTVSGLSAGAFMAVQLQVAYSASIAGAGVVAGGPYYCAIGNAYFRGICMGQVAFFPPSPSVMVGYARAFAAAGSIDPLTHLRRGRSTSSAAPRTASSGRRRWRRRSSSSSGSASARPG